MVVHARGADVMGLLTETNRPSKGLATKGVMNHRDGGTEEILGLTLTFT